MRLIPGKTKVQIELFKGISIWDIVIGTIGVVLTVALMLSSLPFRFYIAIVIAFLFAALLVRIDTTPNYVYLLHILRHYGYRRHYERVMDDDFVLHVEKDKEELYDVLFGDMDRPEQIEEAKKGKRAHRKKKILRKQEAALYREESKKLRDKSVSAEEKDAIWKARAERSAQRKKRRAQEAADSQESYPMDEIMPFTNIKDGYIWYDGKYYGAVLEIPPVEFKFFSPHRKAVSIEAGVGKVLRSINMNYSANIVKIDRPINYDAYMDKEYDKLDELRRSYESGLLTEEELQARVEILYDRLNELNDLCDKDPVIAAYYYLVLYDSDKKQLDLQISNALDSLEHGEINAHRLDDKELAVFLRYTNEIDFDERDIEKVFPEDYAMFAMPNKLDFYPRSVYVNNIMTYTYRMVAYPMMVDDAWLAAVMSMPAMKVVVKCKPIERDKAIRSIDRSLSELRVQLMNTGLDSKAMELQDHISTLSELLATLQQENENLLQVNIYVTAYDITATRENPKIKQPPLSNRTKVGGMKRYIRKLYQEYGFRLTNMDFDQMLGFIGSQVSGYDPFLKEGRGIPSNSVAACYPWIFANVSDVGGIKLGSTDGIPVFLDFFRRDSERVNSNVVIVGKSGSGKSYATKEVLANLAAEDAKIFILDPENEYTELAKNLHGKFINVGNAQQGRINPFQIITALDDDENEKDSVTGSYATHLQFLEEFFKQILPDCDKDALEYLNNLVDRMYTNFGITGETDLSKLKPEDYPVFDDLYDAVLAEFQQIDNEYIRTILRTLMNYVAKFSTGGRNSNIWNGPSTITTDENFTVFNFQSLLANRNSTIANAQMLLVLKYIDNEIIKNRDYNKRYNLNRKVVVAIDEAHVFIDNKFPIALDFMFQLAKRIRKYNGMQIVITQNIKDFVGSEEIARKSTAIINACQYSFIFSLAPNDMHDLCTLYEKAGGINEIEQEGIMTAPRGQAFTVMGPTSRSTFRVEVPETIVDMFQNDDYASHYFGGEQGAEQWEDFIGDSREKYVETLLGKLEGKEEEQETSAEKETIKKHVIFSELTEEEALELQRKEEVQEIMGLEPHEEAPEKASSEENQQIPVSEESDSGVPEKNVEDIKAIKVEEPQQNQKVSQLEELLMKTLGEFSHQAMIREIKKAVREEVIRELDERGLLVSSGAQQISEVSEPDTVQEQTGETSVPIDEEPESYESYAEEDMEHSDNEFDDHEDSADAFDFFEDEETDDDEKEIDSSDTSDSSETLLSWMANAEHEYTDDEEDEDRDFFDEDDAFDEDIDLYAEDMDDVISGENLEVEDEASDFDIMGLLMKQAKEMENIGPIEMMDAYDEQVVDISLDELAAYVLKHR